MKIRGICLSIDKLRSAQDHLYFFKWNYFLYNLVTITRNESDDKTQGHE